MPRSMLRKSALALAVLSLAPAGVASGGTASAAGCPSPGGVRAETSAVPAAEVVFPGHGWGHQLGMSQYGAQGAATLGCGYRTILGAYYRGTDLAWRSMGDTVLIDMLTDGGKAKLHAEGGDVTWRVAGSSRRYVQPEGETWQVSRAGSGLKLLDGSRAVVTVGSGTRLGASHSGTVVGLRTYTAGGSLVHDRRMRWDSARFVGSSSGLTVRQVITDNSRGDGVAKYLKGIAEMPVSWRLEALTAQVVAARTYLSRRWSDSEDAYLILPTPAHQNYLGATQEEADRRYGATWARAVERTTDSDRGMLLVDSSGRAVETLYSSSFGGRGEDPRYVWESGRTPYLNAIDDSRWDAASSNP